MISNSVTFFRWLGQVDAHLNRLILPVYLSKADSVIERNGSTIGGVDEQVDVASPCFLCEGNSSFEQVLSHSLRKSVCSSGNLT